MQTAFVSSFTSFRWTFGRNGMQEVEGSTPFGSSLRQKLFSLTSCTAKTNGRLHVDSTCDLSEGYAKQNAGQGN